MDFKVNLYEKDKISKYWQKTKILNYRSNVNSQNKLHSIQSQTIKKSVYNIID